MLYVSFQVRGIRVSQYQVLSTRDRQLKYFDRAILQLA